MSDRTEDFWAIIASRDAALAHTHRLYQKWIADLNEANASTKAYLTIVEADREARLSALKTALKQLHEHGAQRHHAEAQLRALGEALGGMQKYINEIEADRVARLEAIQRTQEMVEAHGLARHHAEARARELEEALGGAMKYITEIETDRAARLKVIETLQAALDSRPSSGQA